MPVFRKTDTKPNEDSQDRRSMRRTLHGARGSKLEHRVIGFQLSTCLLAQ
jgi:hypothetical protein